MKRIFRTKVMMTAAVLLMAAVPGRQRLAAQEAGVQDPDVEQADGKQGGVMQLTLEGAMDLACSQSVDAAVALNQLKSAYWQFRTYKAERQQLQFLSECRRNLQLRAQQLVRTLRRAVRDSEHSVYRRYGLAEHRSGHDAAAGRECL